MQQILRSFKSTLAPDNDHPFLHGPFTPAMDEYVAHTTSMKVIGEIPKDLHGIYVRNTHNQVHESIGMYHPFDGDGMIHMASFHNGRMRYRNRFVQTKGLAAEMEAGRRLWAGLLEDPRLSTRPGWGAHGGIKDASSTDVVVHAGRALTSYYQCGEGYRMDPLNLDPQGLPPWSPLDGISAHSKVDEPTGELLFFNYGKEAPYMHYGVMDRHGELKTFMPVQLPGPRLPHDMAITHNYTIVHDLPLFYDMEAFAAGRHKLALALCRGATPACLQSDSGPGHPLVRGQPDLCAALAQRLGRRR